MREIKFRVWDKDIKRMHICGEDIHDEISFEQGTNKAYYYNLQNGCGSLTENSSYILMEYTGLKDKNGKEIYEGDIVECTTLLKKYRFTVKYSNKYAQYIIVNTSNAAMESEPLGDYENLEVIGNIYDNLELLEEGLNNGRS